MSVRTFLQNQGFSTCRWTPLEAGYSELSSDSSFRTISRSIVLLPACFLTACRRDQILSAKDAHDMWLSFQSDNGFLCSSSRTDTTDWKASSAASITAGGAAISSFSLSAQAPESVSDLLTSVARMLPSD